MASSTVTPPPRRPPPMPTNSGDLPNKQGGVRRAAMIVVALTLLSRLLGMLRDMVISAEFGLTAHTDAYTAAFKVADLLTYLIAGGALSSTFIPVFSEYFHQNKLKSAWKTFSVVATVTGLVAIVFVVVTEIWTPLFLHLLNFGYDQQRIALATPLTRIILPAQIFFMLGGLLMGTQNARGQFLIPALGPSIYNIGIIVGALLAHPLGLGMAGMMWGGLIGAFIGNFLLQILFVVRLGARYHFSLAVTHPGAVKVWKMLLPIVLGVSLPNVDQIINGMFASELALGSQTAIQFANRLMLIPIGIFAQAMGIAILPTMSKLAAAGQRKEFKATLNQGLRTIFFLTIPASALLYLLAVPTIALLYQHKAFTAADTEFTAIPLRFYALGIFAWSAQAVLTRAFYALQDSRTPVISGTVMTIVFIGMNWLVVHKTNWDAGGLALATSIAAVLHMAVMYYFLRKRLKGLRGGLLFISVVKTLLATVALCAATWGTLKVLPSLGSTHPSLSALLQLTGAGVAGIIAFTLIAFLLRMPELTGLVGMVRRRRG